MLGWQAAVVTMVKKKGKSKRVTMKQKYKIERKVREPSARGKGWAGRGHGALDSQ
jgi:hypothetical protein